MGLSVFLVRCRCRASHGGFLDQEVPEEVFGGLVCVALGWPAFVLS